MNKRINRSVFNEKLIQKGLNPAGLAQKLGVSRAAVSKWISGEALPKPDKLLRIGMILGAKYDELVQTEPSTIAEPVVAYRAKANRQTREHHVVWAKEAGVRLRNLVPCLPNNMQKPPVLKEPSPDYEYVKRLAEKVRSEINCADQSPVKREDLLSLFDKLHAVLIPVFWGDAEHHGNALHVYLPDSMTTWVWLNLDSRNEDFMFWMAHELGHAYAPDLSGDKAEDFADLFAQLLLFPHSCVQKTYNQLVGKSSDQHWRTIEKEAARRTISFYTIVKALDRYALETGSHRIVFRKEDISCRFDVSKKTAPSVAKTLFDSLPPSPKEYLEVAENGFKTPFFAALRVFNKTKPLSEHFLSNVTNASLVDAKALAEALC
jgi:transcriptional regulator with XRE-family HTH domain/Zn-dependent peptidase ImmA (M78 family)